jgi:hypothetical protein
VFLAACWAGVLRRKPQRGDGHEQGLLPGMKICAARPNELSATYGHFKNKNTPE